MVSFSLIDGMNRSKSFGIPLEVLVSPTVQSLGITEAQIKLLVERSWKKFTSQTECKSWLSSYGSNAGRILVAIQSSPSRCIVCHEAEEIAQEIKAEFPPPSPATPFKL